MKLKEGPGLLLFDRANRPFYISAIDQAGAQDLWHMYSCFRPRPGLQGLPPLREDTCRSWIEELLKAGINLVARRPGKELVGHCAVLPDPAMTEAEFMIFVHQDHRNLSIGTQLCLKAVGIAREMGIERLWLCVSPYNIPAIRLYLKTGFQFRLRTEDEIQMELILTGTPL